jgi:DNA-binding protein YbaB
MFIDKIKEVNKFNKMRSELNKEREQIFVTQEKKNVRIVVRGDNRIEKLEIDGEDQKDLKEIINDSFKEVEKKVEKQMRGHYKDLGLPDL